MVYIRFYLPVLLSSYSIVNSNINYNFIRLCSICLMFFSQIISSSSTPESHDQALKIAKSINEYLCRNHVLTCIFRKRFYPLVDHQQQSDNCTSLLILNLCLHYDTDTIRICDQSVLNSARRNLTNATPRHCFTSSVYKTFYAQHLRSIAPSRTIVKCQIFVLFFLLISFIIKIRACC